MRLCADRARSEEEKLYYAAMSKFASVKELGCDDEQAREVIRKLCREDIAGAVCRDTEDIAHILERKFPRVHCYDCENCPIAGTDCANPAIRELLSKTAKAMKAENVNQEALLGTLTALWND